MSLAAQRLGPGSRTPSGSLHLLAGPLLLTSPFVSGASMVPGPFIAKACKSFKIDTLFVFGMNFYF